MIPYLSWAANLSLKIVSVNTRMFRTAPFGRAGIHRFTFEACSGFTHVTACSVARPPYGLGE